MVAKKLRILCLHGYHQNATLFRSKCGGFRGKTKSMAEYTFVEAPLVIGGDVEKRGWLYTRSDAPEWLTSETSSDIQESLDAIAAVVESEGPFDGILAFSQGTAIASILLSLIENPQPPFKVNPKIRFKFIISVCGLEPWRHKSSTLIDIPSLHLIGKNDQIVSPAKALSFSQLFKSPEVFEFDGGHQVPSSGDTKTIIRDFLSKFSPEE